MEVLIGKFFTTASSKLIFNSPKLQLSLDHYDGKYNMTVTLKEKSLREEVSLNDFDLKRISNRIDDFLNETYQDDDKLTTLNVAVANLKSQFGLN
jgi:hypothetical protein